MLIWGRSTLVRYLSILIFYYQLLKCTNMFFPMFVGRYLRFTTPLPSPVVIPWRLGPIFRRQTMTRSLWTPGKRRWRSRRVVTRSEFGAVSEELSERTPGPFADKNHGFLLTAPSVSTKNIKKQVYRVTNGPSSRTLSSLAIKLCIKLQFGVSSQPLSGPAQPGEACLAET